MRPRIAGAAAFADPAVAAAWAKPQISGDYRTSGLARRVATRWVRSEPEAAMAWLASLPAGGDREDGVLEAYRDWQATRREEAIAWIERQELAPWLEPAFSLYARGPLALRDPKAALALAGRFSDTDRRDTASTYIARGWLQRDHEVADAWLKQSDLPADVVKRSYMLPGRKMRRRGCRAQARTAAPQRAGERRTRWPPIAQGRSSGRSDQPSAVRRTCSSRRFASSPPPKNTARRASSRVCSSTAPRAIRSFANATAAPAS